MPDRGDHLLSATGRPLPGVEAILAERRHQVDDEGFTPDRDAGYVNEELLLAALWFMTGDSRYCPFPGTRHVPGKKGRINDLAKAGAFIAAEIDRLTALEEKVAEKHLRGWSEKF